MKNEKISSKVESRSSKYPSSTPSATISMDQDKSRPTELGEASRFAVDINSFQKLVEGDLASACNLLLYLNRNKSALEQLIPEMYEDYLQAVKDKSKILEDDES